MLNIILDRIKKSIPANKHYLSLMKSMLLIGFLLPFIPMTMVSGVIYYQFSSAYQKNTIEQVKEITLKNKQMIDDFLMQKLNNMRFIAVAFPLEDLRKQSTLQGILKGLHAGNWSDFSMLELIDEAGTQVTLAGSAFTSKRSHKTDPWFREVVHKGWFVSDASLDSSGGAYLTMAVKKDAGRGHYVLRSALPVEAFNRLLEEARTGTTESAFILNRKGQYQTKPPEGAGLVRKRLADFLLETSKPGEGEVLVTRQPDSSGNQTIYAATSVKGGDWLLVHRKSASESLSGLNKARIVTLAVLLLSTLFLAANALRLAKKTVQRIELADKKKQKMNEQMFQTGKLASIGELAAGIAHEINNPVAIMVEEAGWIDDLLSEEDFQAGKNLAEFKRALKQIRFQGKRCKEITHKLLSFARKTDFRLQRVRLNELVEDIIAISAKRAKYSNVEVRTNIQEGLPDLYLPQTEIQQVLLNLINNALDAMEDKGGTLCVSAGVKGETIVIQVSDNGRGIPREHFSRLFDPFFTTKPVGKGTGLGLSICYGIVKKLEGEISVNSVVDAGTTFLIKIPVPKEKDSEIVNSDKARDSGPLLELHS